MADVMNVYQPLQQPQQPQLGPMQVLQLIGQLQQNQIQKSELQSRQFIGQAYSDSYDPQTGRVDTQKLRSLLPNAGYFAPEAVRQGMETESASTDLDSKYQGILQRTFGNLATKPNVTPLDIAQAMVAASGQGVPGKILQKYVQSIPSGKAARDFFVDQQNMARGPETTAQGKTIPGPGGQSVEIPEGMAARIRSGGGLQTSMLPGANDAAAESQKSLVEDQKLSAHTIANLRNLDIALPLVQKLSNPNFGPGSSEFAKVKASLITAGVIDPKTSDATVRQEAGKYLLKYATLAQNSGRSDQALGAALGSNPNLDLTQPANLGLIKNQIALDKMDAALPKIFAAEHPDPADRAQYNQYKADYYNRFDRRVFSYDKLSPEERRDLITSLGGKNSPAYKKFSQTYQLAKQAGMIVPEKQEQ